MNMNINIGDMVSFKLIRENKDKVEAVGIVNGRAIKYGLPMYTITEVLLKSPINVRKVKKISPKEITKE